MNKKVLIEFQNVSKQYGDGESKQLAVNDVSFSISQGEFVIILGQSGAGKSTVLNILGGMDDVTEGKVFINNVDITRLNDNKLTEFRAENVGFIFQFYNLIPNLTAFENVSLIKNIVKQPLDASKMLDEVGLSEHKNKFPSQLSGGEQQRVSIARALCKNPKLILGDEPTGALDSDTGVAVLELLQKMCKENNTTVIIVTHNSAFAECADKVIRLKNGKIKSVHTNEEPKLISEVEW